MVDKCIGNTPPVFLLGSREYPINQTFTDTFSRDSQELTRSQNIALQEHENFHRELGKIKDLDKHIELMRLAILNGMAFMPAHESALAVR